MSQPPDSATRRSGLLFAVSAYVLWGILPGYFVLLLPASALEIVGWRILYALVFCALLLTVTRTWVSFLAIVRSPRLMLLMALAGVFIFCNWITFVLASVSGNVLATSLGYFINPLITVLLGVVVLRERLRPLQWAAVALGGIAIVVLAIGYGQFPWHSLILAVSFALYGLVKKQAGNRVGAIAGLLAETLWLAVPAAGILVFIALTGGIELGQNGPVHTVLLILSGLITAVPLLLFASGARRLPLVTLGLILYVAPVLSFIIGAFVLGEHMPAERWAGFVVVWVAIVVLTVDMLRAGRLSRRALPELA